MKDAYTVRVRFGWCGPCRRLIDPAPHLTWGTWMRAKFLATTIQFKSNPQGRSIIKDNLDAIHKFQISTGAVSNTLTAFAKSLEGRALPASVVARVKSKLEAEEDSADRRDESPVGEAPVQDGPEDNPPDKVPVGRDKARARLWSPVQPAGRPELWHHTDVRRHLPQERSTAVPCRAG